MARLADLIAQLRATDFHPGWGIAQLSWNRSNNRYDFETANKYRAAVAAWFNLPIRKITDDRAVAKRYALALKSMENQNRSAGDTRRDLLALLGYIVLLNTISLWLPWKSETFPPKARIAIFEEVLDSVDITGLGGSGYALAWSAEFLLGDSSNSGAASLVRLDKGIEGVYGAAWDLLYLFALDHASTEPDDYSYPQCFLLTGDKALARLKMNSRAVTVSATNNHSIPIIGTDFPMLSKFGDRQTQGIQDRFERMLANSHLRASAGIDVELLLTTAQAAEANFDIAYNKYVTKPDTR